MHRLQYNEPLVTQDLQAEKLRKFDGVVQYARDKRRQVGARYSGPLTQTTAHL
jgi:hypothetical protein